MTIQLQHTPTTINAPLINTQLQVNSTKFGMYSNSERNFMQYAINLNGKFSDCFA